MCPCNKFCTYNDSIQSPTSKVFMMKAIILLTLICVPGNIITSILVYTHWTSNGNSIEDKNYLGQFNDTGLDDDLYLNVSYLKGKNIGCPSKLL